MSTLEKGVTSNCEADGMMCCSMHDVSGRRGIWYRLMPKDSNWFTATEIQVAAGREGDDWFAILRVGDVVSNQTIRDLLECLSVGTWMLESKDWQMVNRIYDLWKWAHVDPVTLGMMFPNGTPKEVTDNFDVEEQE